MSKKRKPSIIIDSPLNKNNNEELIKNKISTNLKNNAKHKEVIRSVQALKRLASKMKNLKEFSFDTEFNDKDWCNGPNKIFRLVDVSISWGEYDNYDIPLGHILDDRQVPMHKFVKIMKPIFERKDIILIGHNIKIDMHALKRVGINICTPYLFDTMIASWICDENELKGLKENVLRIFNKEPIRYNDVIATISKEEKKQYGFKGNQKATIDLTRIENCSDYAIDDAYHSWKLYVYYMDKLVEEDMDKIYYKTYPPFIWTLFNMEERGITVDKEKLKQMGEEMQRDIDKLQYDLLELAGVQINLGSNPQLSEVLFGYIDEPKDPREDKKFKTLDKKKQQKKLAEYEKKLKDRECRLQEVKKFSFNFPVLTRTAKGKPQCNIATLQKLAKQKYKVKRKQEGVQFCKLLLEYNKLQKLKTAFVDGLLDKIYDDGRCHPTYNPVGTDSGRISCSGPNLMQLPNEDDSDEFGIKKLYGIGDYAIRECFIGGIDEKTGKRKDIISVDYSNLEVRVIAHFSKDQALIKAFNEGKDLHGNTAKMMFGLECDANEVKKLRPDLRQQGKVIAFLLQYGGSAYTLYEDLNKDDKLDNMAKKIKECKGKLPKDLIDFKGCKDGKAIAQRLMDMYFDAFEGIAKFMTKQKKYAHRNGFVYTLVKRKRRLPDINSSDFKKVGYNERLSINACIQGSGADIMINAQNKIEGTEKALISQALADEYIKNGYDEDVVQMIGSERLKELDCEMLLQIHDELIFECPSQNCEEAMNIIRDYMIHPFGENVKLNLPLEVGMGHGASYQVGH